MPKGKVLTIAALLLGVPTTIAGVVFIGMYITEAVIKRVGEPDQSLIFWYLPILFIGIVLAAAGATISIWAVMRTRKRQTGR